MLTPVIRRMIKVVWEDNTRVTRDWERTVRIFRDAGISERRIRNMLSSGPVLDAGCGKGLLVADLLKRGFDAYGFDIAFFDSRRKKKVISENLDLPDLANRLIAASAISLPYPDRYFQVILSLFGALAYARCSEEFGNMLKEDLRILKKGGKLVIKPVDLSHEAGSFWITSDNANEIEKFLEEEPSIFSSRSTRLVRALIDAKTIRAQTYWAGSHYDPMTTCHQDYGLVILTKL